jgi:uncharacterized repeat protein (TIGR03803 family)
MKHYFFFSKPMLLSSFICLLLLVNNIINAQPILVGATSAEGSKSGGAIFKINFPDTANTAIYQFDNLAPKTPFSGVGKGDGNWLYGITPYGGTNNRGAFYRIKQDGTGFEKLFDKTDYLEPLIPKLASNQLVFFNDGYLLKTYNTLSGTINNTGINNFDCHTLYEDESGNIYFSASSLQQSGKFINRYNLQTGTVTVLYTFPATLEEGDFGVKGLNRKPGGKLFGTQESGGANNVGTLFSLNTDGTNFVIHHQFNNATGANPQSRLEYYNGKFYGTTSTGGNFSKGVLFSINEDGSNYQVIHEFGSTSFFITAPNGNISITSNGRIFGSLASSFQSQPTLFKMDVSGANFKAFFSPADITQNKAVDLLLITDQSVAVPFFEGGKYNAGSLFFIDTAGTPTQPAYFFGNSITGSDAEAALIQGTDGKLYGTTKQGGSSGKGVLFRVNIDGSNYTLLHDFVDTSGNAPTGKLLLASDGKLYGTCAEGGRAVTSQANFYGVLYRINTDGSNYQIIKRFSAAVTAPQGSLVEDAVGVVYGTTLYSGASGQTGSTIFKINKDGTGYAVIKRFNDGAASLTNPLCGLILSGDRLYGTCSGGGPVNYGGIFSLKTDGTNYQVLHSFTGVADGTVPSTSPLLGADGKLYGTVANAGPSFGGAVYKMDTTGSNFTIIKGFQYGQPETGWEPRAGLMQASDGLLYGANYFGGIYFNTSTGATSSGGTVFSLDTVGNNFTVIKYLNPATDGRGTITPLLELKSNNPGLVTVCPPQANVSIVANLSGASYQWQILIGTAFTNIFNNNNYSGTNTQTLQLMNAPSSWNSYQFRCVVNGNYSIIYTLQFVNTWTGNGGTSAWETPGNWSCNALPDANSDVIINSGTIVLNSNAVVKSVKVNPGVNFTVNSGFTLTTK